MQPQRITILWPVLISRPTYGRRRSWPGCLVTYQGGMPAQKRSPISVPTVWGRQSHAVFSEHATHVHVRYMLSPVRLSSVCLSVCNVGALYSAGWNFWQCFFAVWYLGHPLISTENYTEIVPGEPLRWGLNARGVAKYSDFGAFGF